MVPKSYVSWLKLFLVLASLFFLGQVTPIYFPVLISTVLAFILNPLVNYFSSKQIFRGIAIGRGIAVLLAFLCSGLVVGVIVTFVFLPFIHEFDKFIIDLPALIRRVQDISLKIEERASMMEIPGNVNNLIDQTISSAAAYSADLARRILNALLGFATSVVELVVVPVLTYYFLRDWKILKEKTVGLFAVENRNQVRKTIEEMAFVISAYIRGQFLVSVVIGIMVFCGMYLLGVPYPLVLGLLATCTETIPIIGPIVGAIPAIMLAYLTSPSLAIKVVIFYLIIHQIENHIVVPNIMGHTIDLHPVIVIISLLIGGQLLGIVGMMIAVPVTAMLRVLIKQLWNIER